jgi:hypothetical protein
MKNHQRILALYQRKIDRDGVYSHQDNQSVEKSSATNMTGQVMELISVYNMKSNVNKEANTDTQTRART